LTRAHDSSAAIPEVTSDRLAAAGQPLLEPHAPAVAARDGIQEESGDSAEELFYLKASYFTATARAGSPLSQTLEMLGPHLGAANTISLARLRQWPEP
jgi:hypothetical protein